VVKNTTAPAPAVQAKKDPSTAPRLETVQKNSSAVKILTKKPDQHMKLAVIEKNTTKASNSTQPPAATAAKQSTLATQTTQSEE